MATCRVTDREPALLLAPLFRDPANRRHAADAIAKLAHANSPLLEGRLRGELREFVLTAHPATVQRLADLIRAALAYAPPEAGDSPELAVALFLVRALGFGIEMSATNDAGRAGQGAPH